MNWPKSSPDATLDELDELDEDEDDDVVVGELAFDLISPLVGGGEVTEEETGTGTLANVQGG